MGLFDNVQHAFNRGMHVSNRSTQVMRLRHQQEDLLRQRQGLAAQLGASLYEETAQNPAFRQGRESLYDGIAAIDQERQALQQEIDRLEAERYAEAQAAAAPPLRCPRCGASIPANDLFCSGCGLPVKQIKANMQQAAPQGMNQGYGQSPQGPAQNYANQPRPQASQQPRETAPSPIQGQEPERASGLAQGSAPDMTQDQVRSKAPDQAQAQKQSPKPDQDHFQSPKPEQVQDWTRNQAPDQAMSWVPNQESEQFQNWMSSQAPDRVQDQQTDPSPNQVSHQPELSNKYDAHSASDAVQDTPAHEEQSVEPLKQDKPEEAPQKRYCIACGAPLGSTDVFCMYCGTRNELPKAERHPVENAEEKPEPVVPNQQENIPPKEDDTPQEAPSSDMATDLQMKPIEEEASKPLGDAVIETQPEAIEEVAEPAEEDSSSTQAASDAYRTDEFVFDWLDYGSFDSAVEVQTPVESSTPQEDFDFLVEPTKPLEQDVDRDASSDEDVSLKDGDEKGFDMPYASMPGFEYAESDTSAHAVEVSQKATPSEETFDIEGLKEPVEQPDTSPIESLEDSDMPAVPIDSAATESEPESAQPDLQMDGLAESAETTIHEEQASETSDASFQPDIVDDFYMSMSDDWLSEDWFGSNLEAAENLTTDSPDSNPSQPLSSDGGFESIDPFAIDVSEPEQDKPKADDSSHKVEADVSDGKPEVAAPAEADAPDTTQAPKERTCPTCGASVADDDMFCMLCGTRLEREEPVAKPAPMPLVCPRCGTPRRPTDRFCKHCGLRLT